MSYDDILTILSRLKLYQTIKVLDEHRREKHARELAIRLTNSELANLKRKVTASMRQQRKFLMLQEYDIPQALLPLWRLRISEDGGQMSYSELADALGWSRSRVMRGLKKLEEIADKKGGKDHD
jgi:DNA-binding protein WhiA